ncbi:hypothetical protein IGB42_02923 [Andreprevotia sp. IGB-42]|uniref:hypothetical protein n=1 Tax=Andreprevotia sp. IGB-42 TaxID=2497473 RepID=UPI00135BA4B5|nr:hypothetical protein [Andreprevotia sp. IGB-42]KAF0812631.1 hypothetical protein IGB42_02923 [Andreprevotia sp. IGB-42]
MDDFAGKWVVSEVVGYAEMGGGIPHAKALLGKVLTINKEAITFNGKTCKAPFGVRVVDTRTELKENSAATREDAKLPAKAPLLAGGNCPSFFWVNKDQIEFDDLGVFVRADRDRQQP